MHRCVVLRGGGLWTRGRQIAVPVGAADEEEGEEDEERGEGVRVEEELGREGIG